MDGSLEKVDVENLDLGINGLVNILREKYRMSDSSIVIFFTAVLADEEKLSKDFILQNILSRNRLEDLREQIRSEFDKEVPDIAAKDLEGFIKGANVPVKDYI
ncbi:MAG: hypothetical protein ACMG57_02245 [Candidatus Dojkabacteria bacterium]